MAKAAVWIKAQSLVLFVLVKALKSCMKGHFPWRPLCMVLVLARLLPKIAFHQSMKGESWE